MHVLGLLAVLVLLIAPALAHEGVTHPKVHARMDNMLVKKQAVDTLAAMIGGRMIFDADRARMARRNLIRSTAATPRLFRRPHADPLSRARSTIWTAWPDFERHAHAAERAARGINPRSLAGLRRSLPVLLRACLDCHRRYRHDSPTRP